MDRPEVTGSGGPVDLLVANHRRFLAFLERRTGSREEAEDILQDAFVRGVERAGSVRDEDSVVAWFFRVLRNAVVDRHRRRAKDAKALDEIAGRIAAEGDPELERAICDCIAGLVPLLHADYAELIRRVDLGGEAIGALAAERGVSAGSARVRLHRARAALRREVERTCRTCAEHGCLDCSCGAGRAH
jgi:RNA polymerase sigma-70 factor (ECF subfamily)